MTRDEAIKLLKMSDQAIWLKGLEKEQKEATEMAIKDIKLVAKMEQDCEALKNKIPKVNLTESYRYCFLTEYLEVSK